MELRKDYILNRWVIISEGRTKRPHQFKKEELKKSTLCVFCPGREEETPPELFRIEEKGKWKIRVIPNKYPAIGHEGEQQIYTHNIYYTFSQIFGEHELIIETPAHKKLFGELSLEELQTLLKVYMTRINDLENRPFIKYALLFKNQGKEGGASIEHTHSQIIATPVLPPVVNEKIEAIKKYSYCPYCDIIEREKNSYRRAFENELCVAFTPYASRFNYEIWVFPKQHVRSFNDFDASLYKDFASILKTIAQKLESVGFSYDMLWYYSPAGENLHFHVEVLPRIAIWAGFEHGSGIIINVISPESAAKFYRGENE